MAERSDSRFDLELDRRLVEGLIQDREATLDELAELGIARTVALRRAESLGLTKEVLRRLEIRPGQIRVLPCLGCEDRFLSHGAHNRFCDPCRKKGERRVSG